MKKKNILIAILSVAMLASCGTKPGNNNSVQAPIEPDDFEILTDLDEQFEIHTEAQKEYLNYDGEYKTIPTNLYPDGNGAMSDSDPKPVKIEWNYEVPEDKELDYYTVSFDQNEELENPYVIKGTTDTSLDLYNVYLGQNFFKVTAEFKDGTNQESHIYSFDVDETAPRNLQIDGMTNCRDMGGRVLTSGGKIKQGLLFRTSGVVGNYPSQVTEKGIYTLENQLKVKTEINVSDGTQYNGTGHSWQVIDCLMNYNQDKSQGGTIHHFARNCESIKKVFSLLADEENYPVFYHCRIGTDRTGLIAILVNGLLGLSENEIYQDYLYSNFGKIGSKRYIGERAGEDNIENYMSQIAEMPGDTWAQKTYNTLLSIGVSRETLETVIDLLTDGEKISGNDNGQKIGKGSALTGGTMKTSSDRNNPAEYYTLNSGDALSFKFNTSEVYENAFFTGYIGIPNPSTSLKLDGAIKAEIDGEELTLPDKTYYYCGFGSINGRVCYYFNNIGEKKNLSAGEHTLKLTAKVANVNVGALGVFKK